MTLSKRDLCLLYALLVVWGPLFADKVGGRLHGAPSTADQLREELLPLDFCLKTAQEETSSILGFVSWEGWGRRPGIDIPRS